MRHAEPVTYVPVVNGSSTSRTDPEEFAVKLLLEDYASMRDDLHEAWTHARAIVTWGFAIGAALIAAAMLTAVNASKDKTDYLHAAGIAVLSIGLPGFAWISALTWLGEQVRSMRASYRLSEVERQVASVKYSPIGGHHFGFYTRVSGDKKVPLAGPQVASTFGIVVAYVALAAGGEGLAYAWVQASALVNQAQATVILIVAITVNTVGIGFNIAVGIRMIRLNGVMKRQSESTVEIWAGLDKGVEPLMPDRAGHQPSVPSG